MLRLEGESMFRGLLEGVPDAILIISGDGRIVLVNGRAEGMFGYERQELIGQSVELVLSPRFREIHAARRVQFFSEPQAKHVEFDSELAARRKDGSEFPVETTLSTLNLDGGLGMTIVRDITQRKLAATELQDRARQEAAIAQFGRQAVVESDLTALMSRATELIAHTLGVDFSAVLEFDASDSALLMKSLSFASSAGGDTRGKVDRSLMEHAGSFAGYAARTGQGVIVTRADEETRVGVTSLLRYGVTSATAVPLNLHDRPYGALVAYSVAPRAFSIEDVHFLEGVAYLLSVAIERRHAEEAVRRDRDFAESLIQTAQAIVLVLDTHGRVVRFNPYTRDLTGFAIEDVRGADWVNAFLPEPDRAHGRNLFDCAASGDRLCNTIQPIVTKAGVEHEIEWSCRALTDENSAVLGVLFIGHDISELRVAQQRLLEAERLAAIGQMASGLAHESRNALQQIGACAEMLTMELEGQTSALDLVNGVQEAETRLHRLFEDVRAYAVPLRLERRLTDILAVWKKACDEVSAQRPQCQAKFHPLCAPVCECPVDAPTLQQAFRNILDNCFDACTETIDIWFDGTATTLNDQPALRISIRDSGPGFTPLQERRILEPFYTTKTKGTGLGMSIVQRIVEAHGGKLEARNAKQGGAEFLITLPKRA